MNMIRVLRITKIHILSCSMMPKFNVATQLRLNNVVFLSHRSLSTTQQKPYDVKVSSGSKYITINKVSLMDRFLKNIPFFNVEKYRLGVSGYLLYESVADSINYGEFFDEFALPDTFYSWFVITEIHVWLLMVRCMAEGKDGKTLRNAIVQALWADVGLRAKKLGSHNPSGVRAQIKELSEQFQAALIAYDEGLQSDDMVLAGAIWRRLYQQQEANPEQLDCMVKYIRKQMRFLDNISPDELFSRKKINWEALNKT